MRVFPFRVADRPNSKRRFRRGRDGRSASTLLAVALVSAVAPVVVAPAALAQSRANATRPDQTPAEDRRATTARRQQPNRAPADDTATVGEQEADQSRLTDTRGTAPQRPATGGAVAAGDVGAASREAMDAGDGDVDPDVGDGAQRLAASRPPGDGDLRVVEPQAPRDGEVQVEPVQVVIDGELELIDDMAAEDPELEDALRELERPGRPITQRRHGPYQPVGIRVGSFILFPVLDTGVSRSNNVFRSATNAKSDIFADLTPAATLVSNWSRHALELRVQSTNTFHGNFPSEDDRRLDALVRGRFDISRRTYIVGEASYNFGQESRGGVNTPTALGERPNVITQRAALEANHRINRLTLQARTAVIQNTYGIVPTTDALTGVTTTATVNDRNYTQHEVGGRAGWQFSPNLTLYADTVLNSRRHEAAGVGDGILRNSQGYRLQGGVAVNAVGKLQGEASAGVASQTPDDARLRPISGFIYNGRLSWQPTGLTEVIVEARSDIGDTTVAGSAGALTRQVGVEVRHALRRHIILVAGASYAVATYGGTVPRETSTIEKLGFEYYLSRETAVIAGYQHTAFDVAASSSPTVSRNFDDHTVRVGLRLRQ